MPQLKSFFRNGAPAAAETPDRRESGLTLVEILVVAAMLLGVTAMLLVTFTSGQSSFVTADTVMLVQQESRRAFDTMVRELREAGQVSTTTMTNGAIQLNFQIVRGYNQAGCADAICWGNEDALDGYVHYSIVGAAGNSRQLIRCINGNASAEVAALTSGCRVLANYVQHPNSSNAAAFVWSAATQEVTINLEIAYQHPALPGGSYSSGVLSTRVALRN